MEPVWNAPPTYFLLSKKDVHIWRATLDLPYEWVLELKEKLSIDEGIKAERFRLERDRKRFIAGVGILRTILGRYLNIDPGDLQFSYGKNGKPRLSNTFSNETIHFNLSHSEGLALYAFTRDRDVGVDVERIRDFPEMEQIVEQFFSEREKVVFSALPGGKKREAFFSCWTRKEAFIKATGAGLSMPLERFEVSMLPGEPVKLLIIEGDEREASRWSIGDLKPAQGFAGAFAIEGGSYQIDFWQWSSL